MLSVSIAFLRCGISLIAGWLMTRLLPAREKERLAALDSLGIVDTIAEHQYDAVCRFACDIFQVPIAYIAFIDDSRQWLKAACGMSQISVPRVGTFCARTILLDRVLVVGDASTDKSFASNRYVLGTPHIRFYAGAPLTLTEGIHVGTVCLIDTAARAFSEEQAETLRGLAKYVVRALQSRVKQRAEDDSSFASWVADGLRDREEAAVALRIT